MNLIKAELMKLFYPRRTYGILLAAIAIAVLGAAFTPYALSKIGSGMAMPLTNPAAIDSVYSKALAGYIFAVIIGVHTVTSEFNNHTAIATYLAAPKRWQPMLAKISVAAIGGALLNLIATLVGMGSAAYALTFYPEAVAPASNVWFDFSMVALLTGAVLSLIGVGIGALIRNQNAAVSISFVWLFLIDRLLAVLFVDVGKYLPTGLVTSLMNLKFNYTGPVVSVNTGDYLEPWPATGLLVAYGAVFVLVALFTTNRRDID
jgi:ABC-type transport system involved in multi-copper enzyme maturation permease subunit